MYLCVGILLVVLWIAYVQHQQNQAVKDALKKVDGMRDLAGSVSKSLSDARHVERIMSHL
jgi:hypothetical protein